MKCCSRSDKGDEMGEAGELVLAKMRFGQTNKNTLHHYIYIVSLAGGRQNKQKRDRHFIIIYISSAWQGKAK